MKGSELLNDRISAVIAKMGHTDTICVTDCGMPIPDSTERIDIALKRGVPGFIETIRTMQSELVTERAYIASEMPKTSPKLHSELVALLGDIEIIYVPHDQLKRMTASCRACVRTGEATSYANVILVSGVRF